MKIAQEDKKEPAKYPRSRAILVKLLILLNAFVLGGCLALAIVNRQLNSQLDIYISYQSMDAASTIIDFMEDLLPIYLMCGSAVLLLLLVSATVWAWTKTQSRFLRYGTLLLILLALLLAAGMWLMGGSSGPIPMPVTPTATPSLPAALR